MNDSTRRLRRGPPGAGEHTELRRDILFLRERLQVEWMRKLEELQQLLNED